MKEIWKDIKGYEGMYQVSNLGRVKSLDRVTTSANGRKTYKRSGMILKQTLDSNGYFRVKLYNKKHKTFKVHRLVAEAFIPNPDNKPTVDHIDTDKTNNVFTNLRWFDWKEQATSNEITVERKKKTRKRIKCITTGMEFDSVKSASEYYNITDKTCPTKKKYWGRDKDGNRLEWEYID